MAEILHAIENGYGSLEQPNHSFAKEAMDNGVWKRLVSELREHLALDEITDLNSDVSRVFQVHGARGPVATLQLSFVGPYAVYFRHEDLPWHEIFVERSGDARTDVERLVVTICENHGIIMLGLDVLRVPVALKLFDAEPERVRVYQALFSDVDFIPGEYDESIRNSC